MEEMNETEFKEFRLVLITLACQTWTLSCLFDRVSFPTSTLQATLTSSKARLKKMSAFLLIDKSFLEPNSDPWAPLHRQKVYVPSQYSLAGARFGEIFRLFTLVYALCFELIDYNGTGSTRRKNNPCYWVAVQGHTPMEIKPADEAVPDVFLAVAAECENQILNILSEFHFFTERMSGFYPNFSPLKTVSSDMVDATPSTQVSARFVRILQAESWFFGGEFHFGTDPNKLVTAEYWSWGKESGPWKFRVPNFMTLRLREIGKSGLEIFAEGEHTSKYLERICDAIMHLATTRRINKRFTDMFAEPGTPENVPAAGILLCSDELRVSIDYARVKEKTVCLFENCLVFARQKGHELVMVRRVFLSDLLQVRYRVEHLGNGSGFLTTYWRERQPSGKRKVSAARMFFNDLDVLKIWAAFLAINTSTEPAIGMFLPTNRKIWNMPLLGPTGTTVRGMVASMRELYW